MLQSAHVVQRAALPIFLLLLALPGGGCRRAGRGPDAARIHREAVVFDAHCDTLMRITDEGFDLGRRARDGHVDLPRLAAGGVDVQVFAVSTGR